MATEYIDKDDNVIDQAKWKELREDVTYVSIKQYDNGQVHLKVEWWGKIVKAESLFDKFKGVFKVKVWNYLPDGSMQPDGANGETTHRTEAEAIKHYEEFLTSWTASHENGGRFVEEGNTLKPINPDLPESDIVVPGFDGDCAW